MFDKLSDYQLFKEYPAPWNKQVSIETVQGNSSRGLPGL
jgi:hypothetical protein